MTRMFHSPILLLLLLPADVLGKYYNGRCSITSIAAPLHNYLTISPDRQHNYARLQLALLLQPRGGGDNSIQINDEDDEGEYENYDEEEEDEEEEEEETIVPSSDVEPNSNNEKSTSIVYDTPWVINPINSFMVQLAVMMMCRKVDMKEYRIIRLARYVFLPLVHCSLWMGYYNGRFSYNPPLITSFSFVVPSILELFSLGISSS